MTMHDYNCNIKILCPTSSLLRYSCNLFNNMNFLIFLIIFGEN